MRNFLSAVMVLLVTALVLACGDDEGLVEAPPTDNSAEGLLEAVPASDVATVIDVPPAVETEGGGNIEAAPVFVPGPASGAVTCQIRDAEGALFVGTRTGYHRVSDTGLEPLFPGRIVGAALAGDGHWIALEGLLRTLDGSVQIVPEFPDAISAVTVHDGRLYVGTRGQGVWALQDGVLTAESPAWDVEALVSTGFGLFAATGEGLFSLADDRWRARRLSDTSTALEEPWSLYYRYPYLYVGTGGEVLRYDGGNWERFVIPEPVTAMGWHNARLYMGTVDGLLFTLEGTILEEVAAPAGGAIHCLLRFDGRLHVGTDDGLFRLRHGHFQKLEVENPVEREPKTEPIASLL